jgi:hypothetical protein
MRRRLRIRRARLKHSEKKLEGLHRSAESIEAQWPEVTQLSTWARTTREHNHLTEIFLHGRRAR